MKEKYPRTPHVPFSEGATNDDKILLSLDHFYGKEVILSEKRDGENSSLKKEKTFARSLDSVDHPSRHWLKGQLWANIRYDIPEDWRICGENLYAKHSIHYTDLKTFFEVFSIWNEKNVCLSYDDTVEWCQLFGLTMVPLMWRGIFDEKVIRNIKIDTTKQEGWVIRLADSFHFDDFYFSMAKWVRKGHVETDNHWMYEKVIPNILAKTV